LTTQDPFPLFILSSVLLEDKQKFKYGGVDQCHISMVVLVFGSSFVRIHLHYFAIYAHISSIMLGFGLFRF